MTTVPLVEAGSNGTPVTRLPCRLQPAGYLHPSALSLPELFHEYVDNGGWARVLYDAHGGLEKHTIIRKILPAPTVANSSTHFVTTTSPATAGHVAAASPAATAYPVAAVSPSTARPISQPALRSRKRAKTVSKATWASSWAEVLAKKRQKRQIPQLDGCFSLPSTSPQPSPCPPALLPPALSSPLAAEPPSIPIKPPAEPPSIPVELRGKTRGRAGCLLMLIGKCCCR